ncbi:MAG: lysophospholipid acyltransferase family protein [Alkalispirochaeta sp.]
MTNKTRMPLAEFLVNSAIRGVLRAVCRIEHNELSKIPMEGPAILVTNHTTNFEGPIYYVLLDPRRKTALGKRELWENPLTRFIMQLWGVIPLNRGGADRKAMERARRALVRGEFLGIAPEGTRSMTGELQRGRPGAAMIATAARVPVIPMVQWGAQDLPGNLRKLRRTPLNFRVGDPFYLAVPEGREIGRGELRRMADEIMYQLAVLMPEELRGNYRDLSAMTTDFVQPVAQV